MQRASTVILLYRWAGHFGPLKITVPCGECSLSEDIIRDTLAHELAHIPTRFIVCDWLSYWWQPLAKGGWHAPIVLVSGRLVSQGVAINRGLLTQAVVEAHVRRQPLRRNVVFGKKSCRYCARAHQLLAGAGIAFEKRDVVREPAALYEMMARAKAMLGAKKPVTVPQIWLFGEYIGGADALAARLHHNEAKHPYRRLAAARPKP